MIIRTADINGDMELAILKAIAVAPWYAVVTRRDGDSFAGYLRMRGDLVELTDEIGGDVFARFTADEIKEVRLP